MVRPIPVAFEPCQVAMVCPSYQKGAREKYRYDLGETASLVDHVYFDKHDLFVKKEKKPIIIPPAEELVDQYAEMIEQHVERRVAFFFQQLVVCYQTKLFFEVKEAFAQANSPDKVGSKEGFQRNAAHSHTIPGLVAYEATDKKRTRGFIFLKGTDSFRVNNTTMNMPRSVNNADIMIDGTAKDGKLRSKALVLINRVAQGELTPDQAFEQFLDLCEKQIEKALKIPGCKPGEHRALEYYRDYLAEIREGFEADPEGTFESLLSLKVDDSSDAGLRKTIYQIRYRAIRDCQFGQAAIAKKVDELREKILRAYKRKPDAFEAAFRTLFVEQAPTPQDKARLQKLFNFAVSSHHFRNTAQRQARFEKTKSDLSRKHLKEITWVAKEILSDMRKMRTQETYQRSLVVKELRRAKGWTQIELGAKVKAQFPSAAASQSTICRVERRDKLVTPAIAREFGSVFSVDTGLFMPHFFYE